MSKKLDRKHCVGCRDNFYNHTRMGLNESSGRPECWNLATAKMTSARDDADQYAAALLEVLGHDQPYERDSSERLAIDALLIFLAAPRVPDRDTTGGK